MEFIMQKTLKKLICGDTNLALSDNHISIIPRKLKLNEEEFSV